MPVIDRKTFQLPFPPVYTSVVDITGCPNDPFLCLIIFMRPSASQFDRSYIHYTLFRTIIGSVFTDGRVKKAHNRDVKSLHHNECSPLQRLYIFYNLVSLALV